MAFKTRTVQGQIAGSAGALLTAGPNVTIILTKIALFGEEADTDTRLFIVPDGGSAGVTNEFFRATSIAQFEALSVPLSGIVLYDGQSLQAQSANANRINYAVSYSERTGE